jgi:hypothetical protein
MKFMDGKEFHGRVDNHAVFADRVVLVPSAAVASSVSVDHVADAELRDVIEAVLEEDADLIRYLADR